MTRSCDGPFGAVIPLLAPSWLTALPRSTARTRCPLARAAERRSSSSIPTPSAHAAPSAPAPKDLQRPSGASPRWRLNSTNTDGVATPVTPPPSARDHSPPRTPLPPLAPPTRAQQHAHPPPP